MSDQLQAKLDRLGKNQVLKFEKARQEVPGPVTIQRPVTIEGEEGVIWALKGPVVSIQSDGVVLRNLAILLTGKEGLQDGEAGCALVVKPGVTVTLENVSVRGSVLGLRKEEGEWQYPTALALGELKPGQQHKFRMLLVVPVRCRLKTDIEVLRIEPGEFDYGTVEVEMSVGPLAPGARLRGKLFLQTDSLLREIAVTASVGKGGGDKETVGAGQFVWPPDAEQVRGERVVVCPRGTGQYLTIAEALRAVEPDREIRIRKGVYRESLVLDKKVRLVGEGATADITIEAADASCLCLQGEEATVRNLTFRGQPARGTAVYPAVCVEQGTLVLENCDVSSQAGTGVTVQGAAANAVLRKCRSMTRRPRE